MRNFIVSICFLLLAQMAAAQWPSTGFAPDIQVTVQSNGLLCKATDYRNGQQYTYNITSYYRYAVSGGVVAWINGSGDMQAVTYDINTLQWKTTTANARSTATLQVSDGIVTCRDPYGEVTLAIYDPMVQTWKQLVITQEGSGVQVAEGTVVVTTWTQDILVATYDAQISSWFYTSETIISGGPVAIHHDFLLWQENDGYLQMAQYDREVHQWKKKFLGNVGSYYSYDHGVLAYRRSGALKVTAYDIDLNRWVDSTLADAPSFQVNQGTVYFSNSSGVQHIGYNSIAHQWGLGEYTMAYCKNLSWEPASNQRGMIYLASMSIGGPLHYDCGDGHTVNSTNLFKKYIHGGNFVVRATVDNWMGNSDCYHGITITGPTAAPDPSEQAMRAFPNPVSRFGTLEMETMQQIQQVRMIDMLGQLKYECKGLGTAMTLQMANMNLTPGTYVLEVVLPHNQVQRRKLIVE